MDEKGFIIGVTGRSKRVFSRRQREKREVRLIRHHFNHVTKLEFLPAFKAVLERSLTSANIRSAF
jgi:hypothetical protein